MTTKKQRKRAAACAYALLSGKYKRTHKCWVRERIKRRSNDGVMKKLLGELEREEGWVRERIKRRSNDGVMKKLLGELEREEGCLLMILIIY
ncbi:hypothetical protein QE152_g29444 [Popillia japonica]|uniref:Uncharacterized protein n=1 Tax=Popillia japonica TaxID=7064 RepID=A0AAW1JH19_POPJA